MIPGNLLGLLLFLVAVAPGYVFVRTSERFRPLPGRSALLEAAELLVIGATSTTIAGIIAVVVGQWTDSLFVDIPAWGEAGNSYLRSEPYRVARSIGFVLPVAGVLAYAAARIANRGSRGDVVPGATVWEGVFAPAGDKKRRGWVAAHLKDGSIVEGYLLTYPSGASDVQAIGLQAPIAFTRVGRSRALVSGVDRAIVEAESIAMIAVRIEEDEGPTSTASS